MFLPLILPQKSVLLSWSWLWDEDACEDAVSDSRDTPTLQCTWVKCI